MLLLNNIFSWISVNSTIISLFATLTLVFITGVYVYFTKKILDSAVRQSNLISNPVIGIQINSMEIGETWANNRRMLGIEPQLINLGNAPAINVLVDAEILLEYSDIQGEKVIPARFEPGIISFIRPGEEINEKSLVYLEFGNTCVASLLDDFREQKRLNIHRIKTDPTVKPYEASKLRICLYYMNNLGQHFESNYETFLRLEDIPNDDKIAELLSAPRSKFYAGPISKNEVDKNLSNRKNKRKLCGW